MDAHGENSGRPGAYPSGCGVFVTCGQTAAAVSRSTTAGPGQSSVGQRTPGARCTALQRQTIPQHAHDPVNSCNRADFRDVARGRVRGPAAQRLAAENCLVFGTQGSRNCPAPFSLRGPHGVSGPTRGREICTVADYRVASDPSDRRRQPVPVGWPMPQPLSRACRFALRFVLHGWTARASSGFCREPRCAPPACQTYNPRWFVSHFCESDRRWTHTTYRFSLTRRPSPSIPRRTRDPVRFPRRAVGVNLPRATLRAFGLPDVQPPLVRVSFLRE